MAITLHLAPEQEARLQEKAKQQGREAESYALALILRDINEASIEEAAGESLEKMLAGRVGLFESDGSGYRAQVTEKSFADHLAEKHQAGHL